MVQDGVQLHIHPVLHDFGRVLAVDAVHLAVDQVLQVLGGVLDLGGEQVLGQQLDLLHLVGNGPGVGDDHLLGHLLAQVFKLRQHLVGGAEEDGAAPVRVGKLLGRLENFAVLLVLRIQEMHVGGGNHRLVQLPADAKDGAVIVL